jgi:Tat protein secretion system quality control protein TatD with DNase activity
MTGLFDTHAHLYDKAFDKDREDVIARIFKKFKGCSPIEYRQKKTRQR